MKKATVLTVDLKGFSKRVQAEDSRETAVYLTEYYRHVDALATDNGWRFVKSMGDCIMIVANGIADSESMKTFFENVSGSYPATVTYRDCEFIEQQVEIGDYRCLDLVGKDICALFLRDGQTATLD